MGDTSVCEREWRSGCIGGHFLRIRGTTRTRAAACGVTATVAGCAKGVPKGGLSTDVRSAECPARLVRP